MTRSIPVELIEQIRSVVSQSMDVCAAKVERVPVFVSALLPLWVALITVAFLPIPIAMLLTALSLPVYFVIAKRGRLRWVNTPHLKGYVTFFLPILGFFYALCFLLLRDGSANALIQSFIYVVLLVVLVTKPGWSKKKSDLVNDRFFALIFYIPTILFVFGSMYYGIHQL